MSCQLWGKALSSNGYGLAKLDGRTVLAHRKAYCEAHSLTFEDIRGKVVRHTCDVRACINPEHLILGTHQDNMDDMTSRGRHNRGEDRPQSKLTAAQVQQIREEYTPYSRIYGIGAFSRLFGVHPTTAYAALRGVTWQDV